MANQIAKDRVTGPLGTFDVSTVQTFSGGGGDNKPLGSPFSESDYASDTPWPFETVVFRPVGVTGLYHAPYATKDEALEGHRAVIELIKGGTEFRGTGVKGDWGIPSITPEEWKARQPAIAT